MKSKSGKQISGGDQWAYLYFNLAQLRSPPGLISRQGKLWVQVQPMQESDAKSSHRAEDQPKILAISFQ